MPTAAVYQTACQRDCVAVVYLYDDLILSLTEKPQWKRELRKQWKMTTSMDKSPRMPVWPSKSSIMINCDKALQTDKLNLLAIA